MRIWLSLFWLLLCAGALAQDDAEVTRAYRAIPHRYTAFPAATAKMSQRNRRYLSSNFRLLNEAVVARVQTLRSKKFDYYERQIASVLSRLKAQKPPAKLKTYHRLVIGAIEDQREYFRSWQQAPASRFNPNDVHVRSASVKLRQAYGILQSQFPGQAEKVQHAFFDHLCALDFL